MTILALTFFKNEIKVNAAVKKSLDNLQGRFDDAKQDIENLRKELTSKFVIKKNEIRTLKVEKTNCNI